MLCGGGLLQALSARSHVPGLWLGGKEIKRHHIRLGWRPTRTLPPDTFECLQVILDELAAIGTEEATKLSKTLPNSLIGYMIQQDEPCEFRYSCSLDPGERPPAAVDLPGFLVEEFGMHEWCQVVEQRRTTV